MTPMVHPSWFIAHRGLWWPDPSTQNSLSALEAAFREGFGVEVDVRSDGESLLLSHDPLPQPAASWFHFLELASTYPDCPLLIDIKEPGTVLRIALSLEGFRLLDRSYLFDFELCGAIPPPFSGIRWLKRVSDRPENPVPESSTTIARGVWLDQWDSDWVTKETVASEKTHGPVFLVSPELHGRMLDCRCLESWRDVDGLCTDFPHLIQQILNEPSPGHPVNRWWGE